MDLITIDANFINFSIMGLIVYKSSQMASLRHKSKQTSNITLLQYIVKSAQSADRSTFNEETYEQVTPLRLTNTDS